MGKRFWWWFGGVALLSFIGLNSYWYWRWTTFVPIVAPVDLEKPGFKRLVKSSRFDDVEYHVGFDLDLPFSKSHRWVFDDANERRVWADLQPAVIEIVIYDSRGNVVLRERLTQADGWILTNGGDVSRPGAELGRSVASIYKFEPFRPHRFETYSVACQVIQPAPAMAGYQPILFVATVYEYVMLGALVCNVLLLFGWIVCAGIAAVILAAIGWRRRQSTGSESTHGRDDLHRIGFVGRVGPLNVEEDVLGALRCGVVDGPNDDSVIAAVLRRHQHDSKRSSRLDACRGPRFVVER